MSVRSKVSRAWACGSRLLGPLKAAWNPGWYWVTNVLCPWSPHQSTGVSSAASTRPRATSTTTIKVRSTNRDMVQSSQHPTHVAEPEGLQGHKHPDACGRHHHGGCPSEGTQQG